MIFALRQPAILLGLLLGFAVGVYVRAVVQNRIARGRRNRSSMGRSSMGRSGPGRPRPGFGRRRLRVAGTARSPMRPQVAWSRYLDPYGAVAALLSGAGWGVRTERQFSRRPVDIWNLLAALVVHGALAAAGFAALNAAGLPLANLDGLDVSTILHGDLRAATTGESIALGFAMVNLACGLLALTPIPPLELGVILWSRLPRSPGARRAAYHVLEEQWGVAAVLLLLLLPLGGGVPPLLSLINSLGSLVLNRL